MNMRPALLVLFLGLVPVVASADAWLLTPGDYYSEFRGGYSSADTYHDGSGERPPLDNGGVYEVRGITNLTELGWKKKIGFRFMIPVQSVTATVESGSSTQSGISDVLFGFKYLITGGGKSAMSLNLDFQLPAGYNRHLYPALGDGTQNLIGTLEYGTSLPFGFLNVGGGYRYRMGAIAFAEAGKKDPDDDMLLAADLGYWLGDALLVSGTYRGRIVFVQNQEPEEGDVFAHMAGLQLTYRLNDRLDVFGGSLSTFSAENELHENRIYAGISVKDTHLNRFQGFLGNTARP